MKSLIANRFAPESLPLTGYWRASYAGAPWVGQGSVGSTFNLTTNTSDPTVGTAVNGFNPALFTGASSNNLTSATNNNVAFSASAGSVWVLFYANTSSARNVASVYANGNFLTDAANAETTFGFTSSGIGCCMYSGSYSILTTPCSIGNWHLAQYKWNGSNVYMRCDGGPWSSTALGPLSFIAPGVLQLGRGYAGGIWFDGSILEVGISNTALHDNDFNKILAYCNARYGLALNAFSPQQLPLTAWWGGSYTAAPWVGKPSIGTTFNLITEASDPTSTTAVNGYNPALFTGASIQWLGSPATTVSSIWNATAGSFWCLFYANTASAPGAFVYQNGCLFGDHYNAEICFGFTTSGITSCIYHAAGYVEHTIACGTGAWHLSQWKWDGINTYGRLDSGNWNTYVDDGTWVSADGSSVAGRLGIGTSYINTICFDGKILDCGASNTVLSDDVFDQIKGYLNGRYQLTL